MKPVNQFLAVGKKAVHPFNIVGNVVKVIGKIRSQVVFLQVDQSFNDKPLGVNYAPEG